jgi:dipeptidyl aminopeptidase/acylaminoacyl peptidase
VGEGGSPFWINNEQFGYIRNVPDATHPVSQELVVASVDNLEPEPVVTTAVLTEALPERTGSNPLIMQYAIAHPTDENLLVLMAASQSYDSHLFQIDRQTREIMPLFPVDLSRGEHSLGFSPDGRFLAATGAIQQDSTSLVGQNNIFGALHLYDLENGELQTILVNTDIFFPSFAFDWSRDGNWLAFTRDSNVIGLLAPAYDYQQMIIHEEGNCTSLAWINPLPAD